MKAFFIYNRPCYTKSYADLRIRKFANLYLNYLIYLVIPAIKFTDLQPASSFYYEKTMPEFAGICESLCTVFCI